MFIKVDCCQRTHVCATFLYNIHIVYCAFPVLPKKIYRFYYAILVLTSSFLILRSFSKMIQILMSLASFAMFFELQELCYCFFQTKVHRLFHVLHISWKDKTTQISASALASFGILKREMNSYCKK